MELCYVLENAFLLNQEYSGKIIDGTLFEINNDSLGNQKDVISILFRRMLAG